MNTNELEERRHAIKYFITKFEAIPEEKWCTYYLQDDQGRRCARGHTYPLNVNAQKECIANSACEEDGLLIKNCGVEVVHVNNGDGAGPTYPQSTPKQRVLAYLRDLLAL